MPNSVSLQGHALVPASYVHTQSEASTIWSVAHNIGLPGLVNALVYDASGQWISPPTVTFVDENHATLTFASAVAGSATVFMPGAFAADSLRIGSQLEVNGVEMTGSGTDLLVGGTALSKVGHDHSFSSLTGKPSSLTGYGITDAASISHAHAFSAITGKPTTVAGYGITDAANLGSVNPSVNGTASAGVATTAARSDHVHPASISTILQSPVLGWKDITSELVSRGGSSAPALTLFRSNIYAYQFSATSIDQLYSTFHIPHDYAPGTAIYFHIHWSESAAVPSGVVRWGFEYTYSKGHGQAAFPVTQTVYAEQACTGQYKHMVAEIATGILASEIEVDGLILVRIFRDYAHANDTSPNGSFAFTCDVHYQCDRIATINRAPNFYA
jgi:hypothetical protein